MLQSLRLTTKCPSADTQYRQHPKKGQVSSPIFIQLFLSFGALDKILKIHLYIYLSSQLVMLRFVRVEVWTPWLSSQDHWLNNVERPVATFNTAPIFPLFWFEIEAKGRLFFQYLTGFLNTFKSLGSFIHSSRHCRPFAGKLKDCVELPLRNCIAISKIENIVEDMTEAWAKYIRSSNFIDKNCDRLPSFEHFQMKIVLSTPLSSVPTS